MLYKESEHDFYLCHSLVCNSLTSGCMIVWQPSTCRSFGHNQPRSACRTYPNDCPCYYKQICLFGEIMDNFCSDVSINILVPSELYLGFSTLREGYFGVYFPNCAATRELNTKLTLEWAHKQFVTKVPSLFYISHDIMTIKTTIFTECPLVSLTPFTFCWWRHNRLLMTSQ